MTKTGKVYLVGAGPGHPDLLTIRAAELLKTAEVIVYDRLIQDEVLALAKPSAEKIFMGKPLGRHCSRQDEIHDLLIPQGPRRQDGGAPQGWRSVLVRPRRRRSRISCRAWNSFEVVPGVSSCLSAPLSAGIAVTHRDSASSVAIVNGPSGIGT